MRFTKTALAAGTFHKGGRAFHVSKDDLKVAYNTYQKIRESGYKAPVIVEHSDRNDVDGLPFEVKPNMSARDLHKYQEGWVDDLRINSDGEIEIDMNVLGEVGQKLVSKGMTYISPQFGPWKHPKTGEELPMAMTHFALTPYPVDINQNPTFKPIQDEVFVEGSPVIEVSQLSQMVSFSLADMVDETGTTLLMQMGQKSFAFNDEDHPHDKSNGQFTTKSGGSKGSSTAAADDEPFSLKKESDKKFVPKSTKGMQTDLFGKTKTTVSPADAHVKKQAESLPGQKTIEDTEDQATRVANESSENANDSIGHELSQKLHGDAAKAHWDKYYKTGKSLSGQQVTEDQRNLLNSIRESAKFHEDKANEHRIKSLELNATPEPEKPEVVKKTPKSHNDIGEEFHSHLTKKINEFVDWSKGRHSQSHLEKLKDQLKTTEAFKGNAPNDIRARVLLKQAKTTDEMQKAVDMLRGTQSKQMSHFDADAAVREKLLQMSVLGVDSYDEVIQFSGFDESKIKRADDGKFSSGGSSGSTLHPAHEVANLLIKHITSEKLHEPEDFKDAYRDLPDDHKKMVVKHLASKGLIHPSDARKKSVMMPREIHKSADHEYKREKEDHEYQPLNRHSPWVESNSYKKMTEGCCDSQSASQSTSQMSQESGDDDMPFPPKQSSGPDNDQDADNGDDFDSGDVDQDNDGIVDTYDPDFGTGTEDPATEQVQNHLPDATDPETWAQIGAALKLMGVIVPDATNAHALLAGLLTAAHHMQKADAAETADAAADHLESVQANQPPPADPSQPPPADPSQQAPVQSQQNDPRLKGTRQEQAFTMSQATAQPVKSAANAANKTQSNSAVPDFKKTPEWQQMSQVNEALAGEVSQLKREKYLRRIDELAKSGRIDKPEADGLRSVAGTFQFSNASSADIAEMEMELKIREKLPKGAIWSPSERIQQLSIAEETRPGFFNETGKPEASESDEDADIARRFAKFK